MDKVIRARIEVWWWLENRAASLYVRIYGPCDPGPGPVLSWFLSLTYRRRKNAERQYFAKTGHGIYG